MSVSAVLCAAAQRLREWLGLDTVVIHPREGTMEVAGGAANGAAASPVASITARASLVVFMRGNSLG